MSEQPFEYDPSRLEGHTVTKSSRLVGRLIPILVNARGEETEVVEGTISLSDIGGHSEVIGTTFSGKTTAKLTGERSITTYGGLGRYVGIGNKNVDNYVMLHNTTYDPKRPYADEGQLVVVNGSPVAGSVRLRDGDIVEVPDTGATTKYRYEYKV